MDDKYKQLVEIAEKYERLIRKNKVKDVKELSRLTYVIRETIDSELPYVTIGTYNKNMQNAYPAPIKGQAFYWFKQQILHNAVNTEEGYFSMWFTSLPEGIKIEVRNSKNVNDKRVDDVIYSEVV